MPLIERRHGHGFSERAGTIAAVYPDVLPRMTVRPLAEALARLPAYEKSRALREKLVPLAAFPKTRLYCACGPAASRLAGERGLHVVAYASPETFAEAVESAFGPRLLWAATSRLYRKTPAFSAKRRNAVAQALVVVLVLLGTIAAAALLPLSVLWLLLSLFSGLFFLANIALRILCFLPRVHRSEPAGLPLSDEELPVYSVLVPLFRETSVLRQLMGGLSCLNYPALCIKRTKTLPAQANMVPAILFGGESRDH